MSKIFLILYNSTILRASKGAQRTPRQDWR